MNKTVKYVGLAFGVVVACGASFRAGVATQQEVLDGASFRSGSGLTLDVLFDGPPRDVPVEVGILTFPEGTTAGDHRHGATEIFFVLEGALEHVVNGESEILEPGMLGFVSPPDLVQHITEPDGGPTRALVIWAPGGEAPRLAANWERVGG